MIANAQLASVDIFSFPFTWGFRHC
jgi:hypothetical protein